MLNELIKIDLHIHSAASAYKEASGTVDKSGIENIESLLEALAAYDISLFSVTDHNRFDSKLYAALSLALSDPSRQCDIHILPGVEFDVQFDETKPHGHVIAIFDGKSDSDYQAIEDAIANDMLEKSEECYSLERFEGVLKSIGLSCILIAHQHSGFSGTPKKRSLTAATEDALELYRIGYIDALEYNRPNVQGILRSELAQLELPAKMVLGSDCHDWSVYPLHDSDASAGRPFCAEIRALPSFRGLLMALTSPETRIGFSEYEMKSGYVSEIHLCDETIPLSPGLNVIIGENGIGKSSLLYLLSGEDRRSSWVKRMEKELKFSCERGPGSDLVFIKQGQLQEAYGTEAGLFEENLFADVSHHEFDEVLSTFAASLKSRIKNNIDRAKRRETDRALSFHADANLEGPMYSFNVLCSEEFTEVPNKWKTPSDSLSSILLKLDAEIARKGIYSNSEIEKLGEARDLIKEVFDRVHNDFDALSLTAEIKSVIANAITEYINGIIARSSDEDRKKKDYRQRRSDYVEAVVWLAKDSIEMPPSIPALSISSSAGVSEKTSRGFKFVRKAKYADSDDVLKDFLQYFNSDYRELTTLLAIDHEDTIKKAIPRCGDSWEISFDDLVRKYSEAQKKTTRIIMEIDSASTGSTLGEMALSFYKFKSYSQSPSSTP